MVDPAAQVRRLRDSRAVQFWKDISEETDRNSVRIASLFLIPGILARIGIQQILAYILGVRILHAGLGRVLGGHTIVLDDSNNRGTLVQVGGPLFLLPLGLALGLQLLIDRLTLESYIPIPAELGFAALILPVLKFALYSTGWEQLMTWFAVSCWWLALVPLADVQDAIERERALGRYRGVRRAVLVGTRSWSWLSGKLGIWSGLITVALAFAVSTRVLFFVVQWRLG